MIIANLPFEWRFPATKHFEDDFTGGLEAVAAWVTTLTAGVTAAAAADVVTITTTTTANDEGYLATRQSYITPASGKPAYLEALIQFTEANTNFANVAFGIQSAVATGSLITAGGGIRASGAFIGIFKKSGETVWRCHCRNGSVFQEALTTRASGTAAYQRLDIEIIPELGAVANIVYKIDTALLIDASTGQPVKHQLDLTSIAACQLCALLRAGSTATVAEALKIDWMGGLIAR